MEGPQEIELSTDSSNYRDSEKNVIARKALKAAKLKIGANRKKQKGWRWEKPETFSIAFSESHSCSRVLAKSNSLSNSLITESNFSSNAW